MLAMELDMRPSVVGFPTGEADIVPVYLGRRTLAVCGWIPRLYCLMMTALQAHIIRALNQSGDEWIVSDRIA